MNFTGRIIKISFVKSILMNLGIFQVNVKKEVKVKKTILRII